MNPASPACNRRQLLAGLGLSSLIGGAGLALPEWLPGGHAFAASPAMDDLAIIHAALTQLHPGLYRYLSPRAFEANFAALTREWQASGEMARRYLALSRFLATIRCGHSYANFFNQKKAVAAALFDRPTRLPFAFRWLGGAMVVTQDQSGTGQLPPGTVIERIGADRPADMLARMMPYARADGHNDAKRRALLGISGADDIEYWDVFHGLLYGEPAGGRFDLRVRRPDGRTARVTAPALTLAQRAAFIPRARGREEALWDWQVDGDGIARLRMDGWAMYNSKWDWPGWLNDRLDSIAGSAAIKGLVVDIRQNEGGNDCGDLILARYVRRDTPSDDWRKLVRYVKTPEALDLHLDTWDRSFRDWGSQAVRQDDRFYRLPVEDRVLKPAGRPLACPLVVLSSAQNSSATFQFCQTVKQARLGTLIGQTTGGNQRGINGGAFFFVRLPQCGLEFDLPLIGYYPQRPMPDAGIQPHVRVEPRAADIAAGRDAEIEAARRHLLRG